MRPRTGFAGLGVGMGDGSGRGIEGPAVELVAVGAAVVDSGSPPVSAEHPAATSPSDATKITVRAAARERATPRRREGPRDPQMGRNASARLAFREEALWLIANPLSRWHP
ncbi:MAG: hypothetical protein Q8P38_04125 [Candidatus Nanopelagicales bacterium]|nr:hypothetical protein [Candidatus Nanopelagicales bacterium]